MVKVLEVRVNCSFVINKFVFLSHVLFILQLLPCCLNDKIEGRIFNITLFSTVHLGVEIVSLKTTQVQLKTTMCKSCR